MLIYTAIYGEYDTLHEHKKQSIDVDFICFTDNTSMQSKQQKIIFIDKKEIVHPRMKAKYFKILSHKLFKPIKKWYQLSHNKHYVNYDYVIWIDGSLKIKSPFFAEEMIKSIAKNGIAMFIHPDRDCIYDELEASLPMLKYKDLKLKEQVNAYKNDGYPKNNGLMANGLICRKTDEKKFIKLTKIGGKRIFLSLIKTNFLYLMFYGKINISMMRSY